MSGAPSGPAATPPPSTGTGAGTTASGGVPTAVKGELIDLPDLLLTRLTRLLVVTGTVTGSRPDGATTVRTALGVLTLKIPTPLPIDRPVTIQIPSLPTPPPGGGKAVLPAIAILSAAPAGTPPGAPPAQPAITTTPAPGAPPPTPVPSALTTVTSPVATERKPPPQPAAQIGPQTSAPARPGAPPSIPLTLIASSGDPPAGQQAMAVAAPKSGMPPAPAPATLGAAVAALSKAFAGATPAQATAAQPLGRLAPFDLPTESGASARAFPALRETLATLIQGDPALARQAAQALPQPTQQLGTGLLFLFAAARGGDLRPWLGDRAARVLDAAAKTDLPARALAEMTPGGRTIVDPDGAEWRPFTLPVMTGGDIAPIHLLLPHIGRDEAEEEGEAAGGRGRRFMIEVELSRLGPLQLDGRLAGKRLDLALRSRLKLDESARGQLTTAFAEACERVGLAGLLTFQAGFKGWLALRAA
ncbi:hypothetical protein [Inquilinus sp. CAU 1745]|uniref:hypothetical protein n=1 Tax=Inquilinus sp. CAU 1745 TaxID=3140369 RepID=UPI00325B4B63